MIRATVQAWRLIPLVALGAVAASSCAGVAGSSFDGKPLDVYSVVPSQADVRTVLGDSNWWAGPPTFGVLPLDEATTPTTVKFWVSQQFRHIGTAEELVVRYTVYEQTSSATTVMTAYQNAYGTSPSSPKVGDQVLYYGFHSSGAAPIVTRTFVRVGQIVIQIVWSRKDTVPTLDQLGKAAAKFTDGLKNLSKAHRSPKAVDPMLLPPPGLDITLLGSAQLPIEAFVTMSLSGIPDTIGALLRQSGVTTFDYADYVLNNDTQMEVQVGLLTFGTAADATSWAGTFGPGTPDASGISSKYIPIAGNPAAGVYHYVFASGQYGGYIVCKASVDGEAASRECESPMQSTALAWKLGLEGLR